MLVLVIRDDPWIMFSITYWLLAFGAMPLVWMLGAFLRARKFGHLAWVWVFFHLALVALATFGHFYLMVEFSAGVDAGFSLDPPRPLSETHIHGCSRAFHRS